MVRNQSLIRLTAPATEPVTVAEAKDHLELLPSDNHHDAKITRTIQMGRERVENDTSCVLITQTYSLRLRDFPEESKPIHIGLRPVSSITDITYYDDSNLQQTLPSSVYGLDAREQLIYLKYDQEWPSYTSQHLQFLSNEYFCKSECTSRIVATTTVSDTTTPMTICL